MPHTLANTLCKKLHQLGEWVGLSCLAAPAVGRLVEQESNGDLTRSHCFSRRIAANVFFSSHIGQGEKVWQRPTSYQ